MEQSNRHFNLELFSITISLYKGWSTSDLGYDEMFFHNHNGGDNDDISATATMQQNHSTKKM